MRGPRRDATPPIIGADARRMISRACRVDWVDFGQNPVYERKSGRQAGCRKGQRIVIKIIEQRRDVRSVRRGAVHRARRAVRQRPASKEYGYAVVSRHANRDRRLGLASIYVGDRISD
jgi:hypothetical protein